LTAPVHRLQLTSPAWLPDFVAWDRAYADDEQRMGLVVGLARENVRHGTGGPFGAAVFAAESGRVIATGVNSVTRLHNSVLHAETMALMLAEARLGTYALAAPGAPACELVTSCDPCAMCLGAALWSGVRRIVTGASKEDATALGFDEGPVFPASWIYLEERGVAARRGVLRGEAVAVLEYYRDSGGPIYNA
jgi:tRNA(Arg) A34 adenosine deaminase TadA